MSEIVVSKFGGTSVADFDAMNRSADIVLSDANVRLVVLSASAGITNLLVALAEGLEPGERFEKLDAIRNIQFAILERLRYPNVIREEIERLLENITVLAEAAALKPSHFSVTGATIFQSHNSQNQKSIANEKHQSNADRCLAGTTETLR